MEHLTDDVDEMVEFWTLLDEDRVLLEGRRGATAVGFALLLKHRASVISACLGHSPIVGLVESKYAPPRSSMLVHSRR